MYEHLSLLLSCLNDFVVLKFFPLISVFTSMIKENKRNFQVVKRFFDLIQFEQSDVVTVTLVGDSAENTNAFTVDTELSDLSIQETVADMIT